ncbi:HypC/HybG/HupF family hydrogenase formation chaperone [Thiococcus pfennigii]|uniref:HypC/HybG/HupF family hydrogenase formation chaperone n=1 Tax=Thiococcus pfennigii TaxID=1057 RepID=UPI001908ED9F|nr:HypC/HybG/HupF family hydrogenase formation chaperone [Thiococcus pfennigii]MBK1702137.1 hydrogenase assembly protein HypC [Thiococcus pfennigii]
MCLGIPMQIRAIDGLVARCEAKGVVRDLSLLMLEHESLAVGDFVVAHLGHATEKITPERAAEAWALYDEILAAEVQISPRHP